MMAISKHEVVIVLYPPVTPFPTQCFVKKRIVYLKEFVRAHVQLTADLGENEDNENTLKLSNIA
jgi:hypothetical protein